MNLYELRKDTGPSGNLFRSVQRQMEQYQGFWMISPDGKALGKYHDWKGDPSVPLGKRVSMMLEASLKAFGEVKPRQVKLTDPLPYRGRGVRSDGSVTLALYGRLLHNGQPDGPMMLDSLTLGAEMPAIESVLIDRPDQEAMGAGETTITLIAAAVANAVFDATGARLREVPFTPARVIAAHNG